VAGSGVVVYLAVCVTTAYHELSIAPICESARATRAERGRMWRCAANRHKSLFLFILFSFSFQLLG
jgi:hypothetical protein